jgi:hypothetical protein
METAWARHFMAHSRVMPGSRTRRRQSFHCSEAATNWAATSASAASARGEGGDAGHGGVIAAEQILGAVGGRRREDEVEGADQMPIGIGRELVVEGDWLGTV